VDTSKIEADSFKKVRILSTTGNYNTIFLAYLMEYK
jgi:hypothetical protein